MSKLPFINRIKKVKNLFLEKIDLLFEKFDSYNNNSQSIDNLLENDAFLLQFAIDITHSLDKITDSIKNIETQQISLLENDAFLLQSSIDITHSLDKIADSIKNIETQQISLQDKFDSRADELPASFQNATAFITHNEVTQKHGTGALVKRIFANNPDIVSIRSNNHYDGDHQFGLINMLLSHKGLTRAQSFAAILSKLKDSTIKRVFCIPYNSSELTTSIAIKELFNAPLGTWIMDDQNIYDKKIPDELMREFLGKCSIRFATHPELRDAYEKQYGMKFWILPAVVPNELIESEIQICDPNLLSSKNGILIGNIWSRKWLDLLGNIFSQTDTNIDWYSHHTYDWLSTTKEEIQNRGLNPKGLLPEKELVKRLKQYPFLVVPTGTLDERDDRQELSQLSLPGRIVFAMATSNIPIIVLGSEKTSAASFVNRFGIGIVSDYTPESFTAAIDYVTQPEVQLKLRHNAIKVAQKFSDKNIDQWVWHSLELGNAFDSRFEELFGKVPGF